MHQPISSCPARSPVLRSLQPLVHFCPRGVFGVVNRYMPAHQVHNLRRAARDAVEPFDYLQRLLECEVNPAAPSLVGFFRRGRFSSPGIGHTYEATSAPVGRSCANHNSRRKAGNPPAARRARRSQPASSRVGPRGRLNSPETYRNQNADGHFQAFCQRSAGNLKFGEASLKLKN